MKETSVLNNSGRFIFENQCMGITTMVNDKLSMDFVYATVYELINNCAPLIRMYKSCGGSAFRGDTQRIECNDSNYLIIHHDGIKVYRRRT